jgi:glutamate---cysteine ligase / carboxylate-amine ligase
MGEIVGVDLERTREVFESSTDFTVGLEEEFAIVDPSTLDLAHRFEDLYAAGLEDGVLADSLAGELIDTEIEIRSGRGETFADAAERQRERRLRLFALAERMGLALASTGTHPWANYLDQRIIDTPHYNRLREELRWVAQRNNTWSMHVHVGVRGPDRAIAVCDHLRGILPELLALSANSPFLDGRDTGLHSVRTEIFTRTFPRCGVHEPFRDFAVYSRFVELLARTGSIAEATQLWWSVRPHHRFGTVELRICDAQVRGEESLSLAALSCACIVQTALDYDDGLLPPPLRQREIEENLWRATRHGLDGRMIDFTRGEEVATTAAVERLVEWTAPARDLLGVGVTIPERNGAQRARAALAEARSIPDIYGETIVETRETYAPERPTVSAPASGE